MYFLCDILKHIYKFIEYIYFNMIIMYTND